MLQKVLAEQAERFQMGLDAVARLVDDLGVDDPDDDRVVLRREPARLVLAVDGSPSMSELPYFLIRNTAVLREAATMSGAVVDGCFGACYPPQIDDDRQDVTAFLPISAPVPVPAEFGAAGVRIDELPSCQLAVVEHRGSYAGLEGCYRRLGTWVAFHTTPAELPVRELYPTPIDGPLDEAVTEVQWPVL
jgi:effector-binding domain-containing protein